MLCENNVFEVGLARGWAVGSVGMTTPYPYFTEQALIRAAIIFDYSDGTSETITTATDCEVYSSQVLFSEIYHGETVDMTAKKSFLGNAKKASFKTAIVPTEGELI